MSIDLSNKSPASSRHSSTSSEDDNLPSLITVQAHLPTFAEATASALPYMVISTEDEPLSFCLTVANQEANMEYPPISPQIAEVLLYMHPDINNTIHAIAFRLIATIH